MPTSTRRQAHARSQSQTNATPPGSEAVTQDAIGGVLIDQEMEYEEPVVEEDDEGLGEDISIYLLYFIP
jgi:hypothetical protein